MDTTIVGGAVDTFLQEGEPRVRPRRGRGRRRGSARAMMGMPRNTVRTASLTLGMASDTIDSERCTVGGTLRWGRAHLPDSIDQHFLSDSTAAIAKKNKPQTTNHKATHRNSLI
eukprot:5261445-Pyramimonas_sp.AAC.1